MVALHRVELVQAVEIHHLNTGEVVDLLARHDLCKIFLGSPRGMQISVCQGHAQDLAVFTDQCEVDAPCVDTDRRDFRPLLRTGDHPGLEVFVERKDIPVIVSAQFKNLVRETGQLLHLQLAVAKRAQNRAAAGRSQVKSQKRDLFHRFSQIYAACKEFAIRKYPATTDL